MKKLLIAACLLIGLTPARLIAQDFWAPETILQTAVPRGMPVMKQKEVQAYITSLADDESERKKFVAAVKKSAAVNGITLGDSLFRDKLQFKSLNPGNLNFTYALTLEDRWDAGTGTISFHYHDDSDDLSWEDIENPIPEIARDDRWSWDTYLPYTLQNFNRMAKIVTAMMKMGVYVPNTTCYELNKYLVEPKYVLLLKKIMTQAGLQLSGDRTSLAVSNGKRSYKMMVIADAGLGGVYETPPAW